MRTIIKAAAFTAGAIAGRYLAKGYLEVRADQQAKTYAELHALSKAAGIVQERIRAGKYSNVDEVMTEFAFEQIAILEGDISHPNY